MGAGRIERLAENSTGCAFGAFGEVAAAGRRSSLDTSRGSPPIVGGFSHLDGDVERVAHHVHQLRHADSERRVQVGSAGFGPTSACSPGTRYGGAGRRPSPT